MQQSEHCLHFVKCSFHFQTAAYEHQWTSGSTGIGMAVVLAVTVSGTGTGSRLTG